MMMNLFSIFDPSLSLFSLNLKFLVFLIFLFPPMYWVSGGIIFYFVEIFSFKMKEINYVLSSVKKGVYKFFGGVFIFLFFCNFFSMFPYVFCVTSHLLVTFPLSYSLWLGVIFFVIWKSFSGFLSHLIPVGTPLGLMSFMVMVEILSNLIRPMALMFRLTANMMAGHLLLSLIGTGLISTSFFILIFGSFFQMLLVFMELGVCFIQAYVFTTLMLLYMSEAEI